jgi:hypothetical protein
MASRTSTFAALALAGLVAAAAPAAAQNLIEGARFDTDVAQFVVDPSGEGGSPVFDPNQDADGDPDSGSLKLVNKLQYEGDAVRVKRCIAVNVPAGEYYTSFRWRYAPGETTPGSAGVSFALYPNTSCSGSYVEYISMAAALSSKGRGTWKTMAYGDIGEGEYTVPSGVRSVAVYVHLERTSSSGTGVTIHLDNIRLARTGKPKCNGLVPTLGGTDGNDVIYGTSGPDVIVALGGDDVVMALEGDDVVCGGDGNGVIYGQANADRLLGDKGDDDLYGGEGDDQLKGGAGQDYMSGWIGNDKCAGGPGTPDIATVSCEKVSGLP